MGLVSLAVALPGVTAALAWVLLPSYDSSGIDFEIAPPSSGPMVAAALLALGSLALVGLTVYWARRRWAGYVLLGIVASFVIGVVGLFLWGIL
jgi:hypothetical protein